MRTGNATMLADRISCKFRQNFGTAPGGWCFLGLREPASAGESITATVSGLPMGTSLNSFAMIFGHCVWIPPSPKAALAALSLFYNTEPDIAAGEAILASQYVSAGRTPIEAQKEVASLNACFG